MTMTSASVHWRVSVPVTDGRPLVWTCTRATERVYVPFANWTVQISFWRSILKYPPWKSPYNFCSYMRTKFPERDTFSTGEDVREESSATRRRITLGPGAPLGVGSRTVSLSPCTVTTEKTCKYSRNDSSRRVGELCSAGISVIVPPGEIGPIIWYRRVLYSVKLLIFFLFLVSLAYWYKY